jgi:hypothetical protein
VTTPQDTTDLRVGAPISDALLALLPLVGVWEGSGAGEVPSTGEAFAFGQRVTFAHDGRPFLAYESRSWLLDPDGAVIRPAMRETGFWRVGEGDHVEVQLVSITGLAETLTGLAGDLRWDLVTSTITSTPTAREVDGERRLYALRDECLVYATELALPGQDFAPHLNATLRRVTP